MIVYIFKYCIFCNRKETRGFMNTIFADKLFQDKNFLNSIDIESEKNLILDFSHVKDFNLKNLYTLLDLQKLALFNDTKLKIKNTTPIIDKVFFETGLYKTFDNFTSNPILNSKRPSFS